MYSHRAWYIVLRIFGPEFLYTQHQTWWRHQMETFSALLAIYAGNSLFTGKFPSQRPFTRSFDFFLWSTVELTMVSWWFETQSRPLWRHCNGNFSFTMTSFVDSDKPSIHTRDRFTNEVFTRNLNPKENSRSCNDFPADQINIIFAHTTIAQMFFLLCLNRAGNLVEFG